MMAVPPEDALSTKLCLGTTDYHVAMVGWEGKRIYIGVAAKDHRCGIPNTSVHWLVTRISADCQFGERAFRKQIYLGDMNGTQNGHILPEKAYFGIFLLP